MTQRWRETDSNPRSPIGSVRLWTVVVLDLHDLVAGTKGPAEDRGTFRRLCWVRGARDGGLRPARRASCQTGATMPERTMPSKVPAPPILAMPTALCSVSLRYSISLR